ncbi:unnamed protein product [Heligmosomoides polygyrus]|uniref:Ig-like domain-containing protein n=1 Tax=Heligmosomoides polygyrus TaxID=6339 RepID=A0A183GTA2_HELPZ|nr:unnamed protein product [Heligmosomoides polygyrus]
MNPEVYPEDSGLYKCTASNPHGTAETAAYINIEGIKYSEEGSGSESAVHPEEWTSPPKFVEQLTVETDGAYDLNYVRLICRVKSGSPVVVSWMKNGVEIVPSEKYELHEFSDGALILTVYSPCTADDGVYTCKAESAYGMGSSSCAVMVPAKETTTENVAESGSETTDTVEPSTLHVIEPSKENYVATTEITKHEEEYKLLVKVADSVASALVANIFVDAEEEIEVTNAPRFETSTERYVVTENDTVTISTTVSGYPTPFIEWYFKDQKLGLTE